LLGLLEEAEAVARAAGDAGALAYARLHQGYAAFYRGDLVRAEARGTEGIGTVSAIPQGFCLNAVYWLLAEVALAQGDDARAEEHFTRLRDLARAGGDEISLTNALAGLAQLADRRGEPGAALRGFAAAAAVVCQGSGDRLHASLCLDQAAITAATHGHAASAVRLFAAAEGLRVVAGIGPVRLNVRARRQHELGVARMHAALQAETFAALWADGAALSLDEAIAEIETLANEVVATPATEREPRFVAPRTRERDVPFIPVAREAVEITDVHRSRDTDQRLPLPLTAREREVLLLLADGVGDKAIGVALGISRRTASQHVAAIIGKLGVESRTAAVSYALREGLLASFLAEYA
jgi:ATP/maltotriose-dependent transcriptional regulator MalT